MIRISQQLIDLWCKNMNKCALSRLELFSKKLVHFIDLDNIDYMYM